jgi:excisionase family DNA binding protein
VSDFEHLLDQLVERVARRVVELLQDDTPASSAAAPAPRLGVEEVAAILSVDHKTVRALIERGELPAKRVGRLLRIDPADLDRMVVTPTGESSAKPRPAGRYARLGRGRDDLA